MGRYHVELATTYRPHDEKHNTNYLMERLERLKRNVFVKSNEQKYTNFVHQLMYQLTTIFYGKAIGR